MAGVGCYRKGSGGIVIVIACVKRVAMWWFVVGELVKD